MFLVERRGDAVHRRDIFDAVWTDVVVSDSALSQAIRTIRRVLDDDSREPRFVRTVSRHGYQFVFAEVVEEDDGGDWPGGSLPTVAVPPSARRPTAMELARSGRRSVRAAARTNRAPGAAHRPMKRISATRRNACTRSAPRTR